MRDLLKLSEQELLELSRQQGLRLVTATGLALASGGLALLGMMARFSPGDETLLSGMDQFWGQLGWSVVLGAMLVLAAWLVRGVIVKRMQWAIAISLLVHLLLCVTLQTLHLGVPTSVAGQPDSTPGRPLEELSLPDYGGLETPKDEAEWQKPADTAAAERKLELERQKTETNEPSQPKPVDVERPSEIVKAEALPRQEQEKVTLGKEARAELERQNREQPMDAPQAVAEPTVNTAKAVTAEAEARAEQARTANDKPMAEREQLDVASTDPRVAAAKLKAVKTEPKPQVASQDVQLNERQAAQAAAAAAAPENIQVTTGEAARISAQEQAVEVSRQQPAGAPNERAMNSDSPASASTTNITRARADRAAGVGNPSSGAPASGGAANIARSNVQAGSAANASAESVNVAAAGGVGAPSTVAPSGGSTATRGAAATVRIGSAATGVGTVPTTSQTAGPARGAVGIARQQTGAGQPGLGQAAPNPASSGGTGRSAGAVGANAGDVAVAGAGTSPAALGGGVLVGGPNGTTVGRQSSGLPARTTGSGSGPSGSTTGSGTTGLGSVAGATGPPTSIRSTAGTGLAARTTEPTARLGTNAGFAPGAAPGLSTARAGADAKLPSGATEAEQTGTLVFAGPQSQAASGARLSGPQIGSVPRRSAGLPGGSGPATIAPVAGSATTQPSRLTGGPVRSGAGNDGPKLASADQVAGLIKKSVPGIGVSPEAKISASLAMRKTESRREATKTLGGSDASEDAVERGLLWLANHQHPDGHWSIHEFHCQDHECGGHGSFRSDSAATGLALLAFLGAGYTHQSGKHQAVVEHGLKWQLAHQKPDGDLFADESEFVWFYSHGMAAIAVCEAYGLTKDAALRDPAQKALDFIVKSQHPEFGGWRYRPRFESDTSVSGWQLMALKSGEMAGLTVPKTAYAGVARWLDSVESKSSPGQFAYHPSKPASLAMTAEGLLMRQYLGSKRDDARLIAGAEHLRRHLPDLNDRDAYYWYYGTQVMFHMQSEYWDEWNSKLRDTLVSTQLKDGGPNGSWNPDRPTAEKWGAAGGRHYVTCLNLLMLEVYYRHLPLYIELTK